jgi:hypothetical protein
MSVCRKTGEVFDAILNSPPKMMPDAMQNNGKIMMILGHSRRLGEMPI